MNRGRLDACYQKGKQILTKIGHRQLALSLFANCIQTELPQLA
jgi:hypothetical protein